MEYLVFNSVAGIYAIGKNEYKECNCTDHGIVDDFDTACKILDNAGKDNQKMIVSSYIFGLLQVHYSINL